MPGLFSQLNKKEKSKTGSKPGGVFKSLREPVESVVRKKEEPLTLDQAMKKEGYTLRPPLSMPSNKTPSQVAVEKFADRAKILLTQEQLQQVEKERRRLSREKQDPENKTLDFIKDNTVDAFAGAADRFLFDSKPGQFISRLGQSGARLAGVRTSYEATTGSRAADTAADIAGGAAGVFVNPLGPASSVAGQASIVGQAYNNPAIQRLAAQVGNRFSSSMGQRVAQEAVREGAAGAVEGGVMAAIRGERPENIAAQTALGGVVGGAAGAGLSAAGRALMNRIPRTSTGPRTLEEVVRPTTARVETRPGLNRVLEEIKPVVDHELTPPLENQRELARWIQKNFGSEISLNEINKLPYEDMRQIAEELRKNINVYDTAVRVARERGHDLENLLNRKRTISPDMVQRARENQRMREVAGVGMPVRSAKELTPIEEVAETARQDWFSRLFGSQGVGIIPAFRRAGRNQLTSEGQIVDRPLKNTIQGTKETTKAAARSTYNNFVDMNNPIKKISKKAYDASMDAARSNQLANVIISDKFVTPQGQVVGQGLQEIVRKAGRGNYNQLTDYLILRHARTRMARGERVYDEKLEMTPEKVEERIRFLESRNPNLKTIGNEWDGYFRNIRSVYGVQEELLTPELARILEMKNPNYAPMRRQFTTAEKIMGLPQFAQSSNFAGQKAPLKEVSPTGSTRKIVDPVRSAIDQTGAWVNAAMRNRVMRLVVDEIKKNPENMKKIAEIIQPPKGQPNLRQLLETEGEERFLEMLQDDFNKLFKKGRADQDNVVRAMIKGEPVYIRVHDPEGVKALVGMGEQEAGLALSIMNAFSNAIKLGATGALAPLFAVRGATMDVTQALIQAENPIKHFGYLAGAIVSSIADAVPGLNRIPGLRNMAQDFYRAGGGYSAALRGERGLRRGVGKMRLDPIFHPRTIAKGVGRTVASPYKLSLKIADIAENMNRIAAYNYKLRQLGGQQTPENVRQAMNYAREITTNYSRRGRQSQKLESIFPYQNAAMQGMYRFVKAWKENPVKTSAMVGVAILAPKALEYIRFHNDEDYQKLPARERYRNLIIGKNEDGTFTKVPITPEYLGLGAFMVDMLRAYKDGDPEAFKGVSDAVVNAYTPPTISGISQGLTQGGGIEQSAWGIANATSLGPILGAMGNQTFYGAPVESMKVSDRSPGMRYDERTTAVAKWLGEHTNLSPMKIDYVIRSYGGDPARLLLPLTSEVGGGTARNTLLKNFIADPVFTNNITNDFYDGKELITQAYRDHQELDKPLPEWFSEDLRKLVTSTAKGSVTKQISALNDEKREVQTDKSLSAEQKAQKLRDIQAKINEIMIDVNTQMRQQGVPILNR